MGYLLIFLSSALLSALSITNRVDWPDNTVHLKVLPEHLWVDQGHTSNGVAGYGFFLGLFGLYVAWRQKKRQGNKPSKTLSALCILLFLAVLFTLSAIIFVYLVTYQTDGQQISPAVAQSDIAYPADKWTPETWFLSVLDLPLADPAQRHNIHCKVVNMKVWRWMLLPIFAVDVLAFAFSTVELIKQRKDGEGDAEQMTHLMPHENTCWQPDHSHHSGHMGEAAQPLVDSWKPGHRRFESGA